MPCSESAVDALVSTPVLPPAIDTSQLVELAGEDSEFVQSVVVSFEKSMAQLRATMVAAASSGELQQVVRAAHQVKGAASNLYAVSLSSLAADIEANARALSPSELQERLARLSAEMGRATAALNAFAAQAGNFGSAQSPRG